MPAITYEFPTALAPDTLPCECECWEPNAAVAAVRPAIRRARVWYGRGDWADTLTLHATPDRARSRAYDYSWFDQGALAFVPGAHGSTIAQAIKTLHLQLGTAWNVAVTDRG